MEARAVVAARDRGRVAPNHECRESARIALIVGDEWTEHDFTEWRLTRRDPLEP